MLANIQRITMGNGCFWCTEAIFQSLKGVRKVESGYMGGTVENPTYMEICKGKTGHAEVIDVEFDAGVISLEDLLLIFFHTHNPTGLNKQGADAGTQYRSVVFYYTAQQAQQTLEMMEKLTKEQVFASPIVTQVVPAVKFYKAADDHQNYYTRHPLKPYCAVVIQPKLNRFTKEFTDKIKPELL